MQWLSWLDAIGFLAGILTLATFAQTSIKSMRFLAIAANLSFLAYGFLGGFVPIFVLHSLLLPINLVRLHELHARGGTAAKAPPRWQIDLAQAAPDAGGGILPDPRAGRAQP